MADDMISIKGTSDGLLVSLKTAASWQAVLDELEKSLERNQSFFSGSAIILDVGNRPVPRYDLESLTKLLEQNELELTAILSDSVTTGVSAETLGLPTKIERESAPLTVSPKVEADIPTLDEDVEETHLNPVIQAEDKVEDPLDAWLELDERPETDDVEDDFDRELGDEIPEFDPTEDGVDGILIQHTVRSGRVAQSNGHIVIMGDVNPGAKVVAVGDVIVWGRLRGMVHAGINGDKDVKICALEMRPHQLRIADKIATTPDHPPSQNPHPQVAFIQENRIVVESWKL